jgi:hypothetical protein
MLENMSWWRRWSTAVCLSVAVLHPAAAADDIRITHDPALCMLADVHSRLRACLRPSEGLAKPRVYFRAEGDSSWYYVEMQRKGDCYIGVLPKPAPETRRIEYYVFAQSARPPFPQTQTPVHLAEVRSGEEGCATPFENSTKVRAVPAAGNMRAPGGFTADGLQGLPKPERRMGAAGLVIGGGVAAVSAVAAGFVLVKAAGSDSTAPPATSAPAVPTSTPPPAPGTRQGTPTPAGPEGPSDPTSPLPTLPPTPTSPVTLPPTTLLPTLLPSTLLPPLPTLLPTLLPSTLLPSTLLPSTLLPSTLLPTTLLPPIFGDAGEEQLAPGERVFSCRSVMEAGARGQVVLNGAAAWFPSDGEPTWRQAARAGANRLELLLVHGGPGTWRLDLLPETRLRPGTLRVVAGTVLRVEERAVVLRVAGRSGERAVVVFELE